LGYGHGRSDAKFPGLVRGTANYTSPFALLGIRSDYNGLAFVFGMLSNFHRWKEGIQVDVQDDSHFGTLSCNFFFSGIFRNIAFAMLFGLESHYQIRGSKR
jgi:hypothetical protein